MMEKNKFCNIGITVLGLLILFVIVIQTSLSLSQKLPMAMIIVGIMMYLFQCDHKKYVFGIGVFMVMAGILTADYRDNILVSFDENLSELQINSEDLIQSPLIADYYGVKSDDETLNKYGLARFMHKEERVLSDEELAEKDYVPYESQVGVQGLFARALAKYISYDTVMGLLHLFYALCLACTISLMVILIAQKYDLVYAIVFFIVSALSQWMVALGRNLYWMEFLWYIPILVSLVCSMKIDNKWIRLCSYIITFVAILLKSLCGYEYISSVMLGSVAFLFADCIKYFAEKNDKWKILLRTMIIMGCVALAGFVFALSIHAMLRGNGNYADGVMRIMNEDVLRRTVGFKNEGVPNPSNPELYAMIASVWETLGRYFVFSTDIIEGIKGTLFPVLCLGSSALLVMDIKRKNINYEEIALYVIFFLMPVSWYVLAKQHSYVHIHNNYVLWYLGFVQISINVIVSRIIKFIKNSR